MRNNINLNQLTLPFGQVKSGILSLDNRVRAFWTLSFVCVACLVIYVYAVNATARNVALRAALEREATELNSEIAGLEFEYIARTGEVTLERAQALGFSEVKEPLYVSKDDSSSLSFNPQTR